MYFLEKLCRICVQSGVPLVPVDTVDFDSVISNDQISSEICEKCANKLRVSYHFLNMCKQSTKIIQSYLGKLTNFHHDDIFEDSARIRNYETVECTDLSVELEKLPDIKIQNLCHKEDQQEEVLDQSIETSSQSLQQHTPRNSSLRRKQRITKGQRCSLLQQLLNRPKKERDKPFQSSFDIQRGGLKNIINFTKNYEFSFNLDTNSNIESTPLDKLTAFSANFFKRDFTDFRNHILYVIENRHKFECDSLFGSEDDDNLSEYDSEEDQDIVIKEERFEHVLIEPDIKVKKELSDSEDEDEPGNPLDYLETTIEEVNVKKEESLSDSEEAKLQANQSLSSYHGSTRPADHDLLSLGVTSSPSVKLLDRLVSTYPLGSRKIFSPSNARCRTRDMPYINPTLKNQFLYRSFKCERCNRYFKSQGYLKAHTSKVH
ncbi:uncharacterized protein LOC126745762 isoform X2 [Anthonomus grandis grandis]|uniref:uncharacterized protein LOC126745762 isoform X2 n=1 Tax=Anthonomus grandis grandis TaxID=2921223 RepID=UPI0021667376|nr:uncharacterized protein LOC126745762 isoform X2 [Anthonomus grandis grandis]